MLKNICLDCHKAIPRKIILKSSFINNMIVICPFCLSQYKIKEKSAWTAILVLGPMLCGTILLTILELPFLIYLIALILLFLIMVICFPFCITLKKVT